MRAAEDQSRMAESRSQGAGQVARAGQVEDTLAGKVVIVRRAVGDWGFALPCGAIVGHFRNATDAARAASWNGHRPAAESLGTLTLGAGDAFAGVESGMNRTM